MERPRRDHEAYDEWGNHPGDHRLIIGSPSNQLANKLLWWILGMVAVAAVAEIGWLGNTVVDLKAEVAGLKAEVNGLNAKVDFIIANRQNVRP